MILEIREFLSAFLKDFLMNYFTEFDLHMDIVLLCSVQRFVFKIVRRLSKGEL